MQVPDAARWTSSFNRDKPSGSGDWETVSSLYDENPDQMCQYPLSIFCLTTGGSQYTSTGEVVSCSASTGLVCKNADQPDNYCEDYKVSFLCPGYTKWTPWFDRDNPSVTGDWETVKDLYKENPNQMCQNPGNIQCQTTGGSDYTSTGEVVSCSASTGLVCKNKDQPDNYCEDYRVRFLCPDYKWTPWFDRDNPSVTGDWETVTDLFNENPNQMCRHPQHLECETTGGSHYTSTGEVVSCSIRDGLICKNKDQPDNYCEDYRVRFLCLASYQ